MLSCLSAGDAVVPLNCRSQWTAGMVLILEKARKPLGAAVVGTGDRALSELGAGTTSAIGFDDPCEDLKKAAMLSNHRAKRGSRRGTDPALPLPSGLTSIRLGIALLCTKLVFHCSDSLRARVCLPTPLTPLRARCWSPHYSAPT